MAKDIKDKPSRTRYYKWIREIDPITGVREEVERIDDTEVIRKIDRFGHVLEVSISSMYDPLDSKGEEYKMNIVEEDIGQVHSTICEDKYDLSINRILKTLSAMKGRLMLKIAPIRIEKIECYMTPEVRKVLIAASKKLKMFGKDRPIIARFDEYGNRLPDEVRIGSGKGITVRMVEPNEVGELYFRLDALESQKVEYHKWIEEPIEESSFKPLTTKRYTLDGEVVYTKKDLPPYYSTFAD